MLTAVVNIERQFRIPSKLSGFLGCQKIFFGKIRKKNLALAHTYNLNKQFRFSILG